MRGYRKWFGVDFLTAIAELRKLGVTVSVEYETAIRTSLQQGAMQRRRKKEEKIKHAQSEVLSECCTEWAEWYEFPEFWELSELVEYQDFAGDPFR